MTTLFWIFCAFALSAKASVFAGLGALSNLGTLVAKPLPNFLPFGGPSTGFPWGSMSVGNTNPYATRPDTGVTRKYEWTITKQSVSPDGVPNELLLVNGQFPGPLLEANWGDWVEVTVHNNIGDEGTAIHWHGLPQQEAPWMDGVPGTTQCPIAPGSSFTYRFKPDLYGSSWYHSHWEAQYASGLIGPMVIHGPTHVPYDIDIGPIMVSEYFHKYYQTIVEGFLAKKLEVTRSDNNLINGKNSYNGNNARLASFSFKSGKTHRLRLINHSAFAVEKISIDNHTMIVVANDFVPVEPYTIGVVTLAPGQRTDIIVKATGSATDAVWLRAFKPPNCAPSNPGSELALAAIFYEDADPSQAPTSAPGPDAENTYCGNDPLAITRPALALAPGVPAVTEVLPIELRNNGTSDLWYLANRTFRTNFNAPQLRQAQEGNLSFPYIENVHNYGSNGSLRFIIENPGAQPHPIHVHGHNMFVLAEGPCAAVGELASDMNGDISAGMSSQSGQGGGGGSPATDAAAADISIRSTGPDNSEVYLPGIRGEFVFEKARRQEGGSRGSHVTARDPASEHGHCWDGTITNPGNPQRRDVQMLLPGHYIVIQWNQDNPGVWPLHCHIAWHLSAGFVWMILERPDDIVHEESIPAYMSQTCTDWDLWSSRNIVDQIDDGI